MNLGQAIKTLRKKEGSTQGEFSEGIGITQSYLSGIENGKKSPSIEVLEKISESLNTPLPILLWFSLEREDVPEGKLYAYDMLKESVDNLITEIFTPYK